MIHQENALRDKVKALQAIVKNSEEQLSLAFIAHNKEVQELKTQKENSLNTLQNDNINQITSIKQSNQDLVN